jgi:zinc transport system substrate-binding protein
MIIYKCESFALYLKELNMVRKIFSFAVMFLIASTITVSSQSKVKVVVSFNAMREFTHAVGKDLVEIKTVIPDGVEPHDFELKASDLASLNEAKIFVYNGFGMEPWVDNAVKVIKNKNLIIVDASKGFEPVKRTDPEKIKKHGQFDPHVWLSLKGALHGSGNIRNALISADPSNKAIYEKNYNDFSKSLLSLFKDYQAKFNSAKSNKFVVGHAAFAYFARDFKLEQNSVQSVFAEGEPSAKKLIELVDYCKKNNIKTIFVEEMVSPKVSETLAKEVGAKAEKIYTIESREDNKDYLESMKANLDKIYNSLK